MNEGLNNNRVTAIAIDPTNPEVIYAGDVRLRIFKSTDAAESWTSLALPIQSPVIPIQAIAIDRWNPQKA